MKKQVFFAFITLFLSIMTTAQDYYLYTGSYTKGSKDGIYIFKITVPSGQTTLIDIVKDIENPSYLAVSKDGRFMYAVSEMASDHKGMIYAFQLDPQTGKAQLLNQKESRGESPCYISISENRKWITVGNYSGGNLIAYAIDKDGKLTDQYQLVHHDGKGINPKRQEKPHVHSAVFTPDNKHLLVPDLGTDKVMIYTFNEKKNLPIGGTQQGFAKITDGSGPRHLDFHPNGKWVYVIEEMGGTISGWKYNSGSMEKFQHIDAHPENYQGSRGSADIHISPDGKFLYASNRYEANNLAIYSIDAKTGMLKLVGFQDLPGKKPRNFAIDPTGQLLLVANQDSDSVTVFQRNQETGTLQLLPVEIKAGSPVCLKFVPIVK
jgi:6-phosphogluconolactonase